MKVIIILIIGTFFISGCSNQSPEVDIAKRYWESLVNNDLDSLKSVIKNLTEKESNFAFSIEYTGDFPKLYELNSNGVDVEVSHYCYPNQRVTTFINNESGDLKIDHLKTMQFLYSAKRKAKTNKKFCYEFSDQPMQGKIDGKEFRPTRLIIEPFLNDTASILYASDTKPDSRADSPKIMLFRFNNGDERSMSGNFGDYTSMTMYSPPGTNLIGLGSFKVSEKTDNGYKLEIYYRHDDENYISGFLMVQNSE